MADNDAPTSIRLVNFVSADQLEEARKTRGARVEDGTAQRDRPLYEILKENKDKKDAEFNERFKHRPPKALDEDETEFLDNFEKSRRELEQQIADEEAKQLHSFQAAVKAQSTIVHEIKETPPIPKTQDKKPVVGKKNPPSRPIGMLIKVQPQAKKAKMDPAVPDETPNVAKAFINDKKGPPESPKVSSKVSVSTVETDSGKSNMSAFVATSGLVSYSDESEDDE